MKKILFFPFVREAAICSFLSLILGLAGFLDHAGISPVVAGGLQWSAFLLLGMAHIRHFRRLLVRLRIERLLFSPFGWGVTLGLTFISVAVLLLLYGFTNADRLLLAVAGGSAFLLPFMIAGAWETLNAIPGKEYKVWFNPEKMDSFPLTKTRQLPVRLKVRRKYFDNREELFPLTAPARWKVGRFFYHFMLDEESKGAPAFEKEDEFRNPYGWQFYSTDFGGVVRKFLDPQRTLEENNVKKNGVIVARRVKATPFPINKS
ncbi:TssN family type VI secretion system protein [Puia sp.]|uniref:TssN family type VI secretion system protein n=1 Tax=Puia sp. TaxID=2045100 RepID=UPI002F417E9A